MLKNKVTISASSDIPAFHATSRHRYIALLYNQKTSGQIEQEAVEKKRAYLLQASAIPIARLDDPNILVSSPPILPVVSSPPKLNKQYKHGSGLWPSPAFGNRALKAPPPVGRHVI